MKATRREVLIPLAFFLAGCSKGGKVADFTPNSDKARQALEAGLNHLQAGNQPGAVPGTDPKIEIADTKLKVGLLQSYEILGEESAPSADTSVPRYFKVRLTLTKGAPIEVRYAVFGIDPLLVFREEDYKALSGGAK